LLALSLDSIIEVVRAHRSWAPRFGLQPNDPPATAEAFS
jgi:hypothetical protein